MDPFFEGHGDSRNIRHWEKKQAHPHPLRHECAFPFWFPPFNPAFKKTRTQLRYTGGFPPKFRGSEFYPVITAREAEHSWSFNCKGHPFDPLYTNSSEKEKGQQQSGPIKSNHKTGFLRRLWLSFLTLPRGPTSAKQSGQHNPFDTTTASKCLFAAHIKFDTERMMSKQGGSSLVISKWDAYRPPSWSW